MVDRWGSLRDIVEESLNGSGVVNVFALKY
jgi:hypothetical protein